MRKDKAEFIRWLLTTDANVFLTIKPVEVKEAAVERTKDSAPCALCAEAVNMTYLRDMDGKKMCVPCAEKQATSTK